MDELKPCPFCGKKIEIKIDGGYSWGECESCGSTTPVVLVIGTNDARISSAKRKCNARPVEDALRAENERLRSALAWYADENNYLRGAPGENVFPAESLTPMWLCDVGERARKALEGGE